MVPNDKPSLNDLPIVMVVEPDVLVRMAIAQFLRDCGYRVIEGVVAREVHAALESQVRSNIVLAEVSLAGDMDGFALAQSIRQTYPNIDVILASGVQSAAEKSATLCQDGPMTKPYHPQDVYLRIKQLLERRRAISKT